MTPYFAFEKELWHSTSGATLSLNRFERFRDEPVLRHGNKGAPDEHRVDGTNVIRTGNHFTMWYHGMRPPPSDCWHMEEQQWVCIAKSHDGIEWEKPDLKLSRRDWGGSPDNVLPDVSRNCYGVGVMQDEDVYRMILIYPRPLKIDEPKTTFSIYRSTDGIRWSGARKPCIPQQHFEPSSSLFRFRKSYWVLGQGVSPYYHLPDGSEISRVMFAYQSQDLKGWKFHPEPAYAYPTPKHFIQAGVQNHAGAGVVDRGRIAIGIMGQLWPGDFSEKVKSTFGLIYSYNGKKWVEPFFAEPLLFPLEKTWESGMLVQGAGLYSRGEYTYYWYVALDGGNQWQPHGSCGVCRVRRDGFASYSAGDRERCTLETNGIRYSGKQRQVYLNVDASGTSPIAVEALDAATRKVIKRHVVMQSGVLVPTLEVPEDRPETILRFRLKGRAKLYAFYLGSSVDTTSYLNEWRE